MSKQERGHCLEEILEYGPVCAANRELGLVVTVNGAYMNLWVGSDEDGYTCNDCRAMDKDMYSITAAQMWDLAKEYLQDIITQSEEENDS